MHALMHIYVVIVLELNGKVYFPYSLKDKDAVAGNIWVPQRSETFQNILKYDHHLGEHYIILMIYYQSLDSGTIERLLGGCEDAQNWVLHH